MSDLPRQHADLPAMVRIMRDKVSKETGNVGSETLYSPIPFGSRLQHGCKGFPALSQSLCRLSLSYFVPVQLLGKLAAFGRGFQPHDANVMHVRNDSGHGTALACGWLRLPSPGRKILEKIQVDPIVGFKSSEERLG